jgi:hypothetical protein
MKKIIKNESGDWCLMEASISINMLTSKQWMGLALYLGRKSSVRRDEMKDWGIDYDKIVKELSGFGFIQKNKLHKDARIIFKRFFPGLDGVQQVAKKFGLKEK